MHGRNISRNYESICTVQVPRTLESTVLQQWMDTVLSVRAGGTYAVQFVYNDVCTHDAETNLVSPGE